MKNIIYLFVLLGFTFLTGCSMIKQTSNIDPLDPANNGGKEYGKTKISNFSDVNFTGKLDIPNKKLTGNNKNSNLTGLEKINNTGRNQDNKTGKNQDNKTGKKIIEEEISNNKKQEKTGEIITFGKNNSGEINTGLNKNLTGNTGKEIITNTGINQ